MSKVQITREENDMNKKKQSAKDIAFEKERQKFRKEIRQLEVRCLEQKKQIAEADEEIHKKDSVISQQKEWIDRLLEYTNMSEDDMKRIIEHQKRMSQITEVFQDARIRQMFGSSL